MSMQIRKNSHSLSNPNLNVKQQRLMNKTTKRNHLTSLNSYSVSAFNSQANINQNKQTKSIQKYNSINLTNNQNKHFINNNQQKRNYQQAINNKSSNQLNNFNSSSQNNSYKEAIQKRKKKSCNIDSNNAYYKFAQELLAMIDTFQQCLISLPLDKLIISQNPFQWISDQTKTLESLKEKFVKATQNSYCLKIETKQYYSSKLQNVAMVLKNIQDNLQTLNKMSLLKNYMSGGTSIQSRNSNSSSSLATTTNFAISQQQSKENKENTKIPFKHQQQQNQRYNNQNNTFFMKNKMNQIRNYATEWDEGSEENNFNFNKKIYVKNINIDYDQSNKQNEIRFSNQLGRKSQPIANTFQTNAGKNLSPKIIKIERKKMQIAQKDQFILKEYKSTQSRKDQRQFVNCETVKSQRQCSENDQDQISENQLQKKKYHEKNQIQKIKGTVKNQRKILNSNSLQDKNNQLQEQVQSRSFIKSKQMNKTISKYCKNKGKYLAQTERYSNNQDHNSRPPQQVKMLISQQSKQTFNTFPNQDCEQKKRQNIIKTSESLYDNYLIQGTQLLKQVSQLKKELSHKTQLFSHLQSKNSKQLTLMKQQFSKKQKHYLQTIYELKHQNEQKSIGIKELLIQNQKLHNEKQLTNKQLTEINKNDTASKQRIALLQQSIQHLTKQLKLSSTRQEQYRETLKLQRLRTKKLQGQFNSFQKQKQLQFIQNNKKIQILLQENQQNSKIIQQLTIQRQNYEKEVQNYKKVNEREKQKQEIYKMKYFKLNIEFEKFKEKVNGDNWYWEKICLKCKGQYEKDRVKGLNNGEEEIQMRQLINFHKRRLLA